MTSGKTAVVLVGGYLLGRFHKARWAMALAGAAAGRRVRAKGGGSGRLLQSPEIGKLTENLRGQLLDVGKAAAVAAASRRMDALSGQLANRTDALRAGSSDADEDDGDQDEDQDEVDEYADDEDGKASRKPKRASAKSGSGSGSRTTKSGSGTAKGGSGAAKKATPRTARKTSARSSGTDTAAKKAASGGRTRTQTARKSSASKQAGGRTKGR